MKNMENETKREVGLQINYLGDSEYLLGYSRSETKDVNSIVAEIQKHRAPYERGKICDLGSATFASAENWKSISAESEKAARNELLKSSSELAELDELERKASETRRLLEAKERELQTAWEEFSRLPDKAEEINGRLANLKTERDSLDIHRLEAVFSEHYKKVLSGLLIERMPLDLHSGVIATRTLRLEIIEQLESDLHVELAELKARRKTLAKRLGQKTNL